MLSVLSEYIDVECYIDIKHYKLYNDCDRRQNTSGHILHQDWVAETLIKFQCQLKLN